MTFLFWNLCKNPLQQIIARLAHQLNIDILIFAESDGIEPATILKLLNPPGTSDYYRAPIIGCEKLEFYTRFASEYLQPVFETNRLSIRHLSLPGATDILIAATHFPDKRSMSNDSQSLEIVNLAQNIRQEEAKIGHQRTLLVGDLNMNPFEVGMVGAQGLHAVMDRTVVQKSKRIVQDVAYNYFYNPMWSLMGDASVGPPGTYYYYKSEPVLYFWNMFDQVLIRSELLERFKNESLTILDSDGIVNFRKANGIPDPTISDHLPILFKLDL